MKVFSNNQAAKKLGIGAITLSRYVRAKKVPAPKMLQVGDSSLHAWTEEEIEHVRQLLPKIAKNGRKTRYSKLREAQPKKAVPRQKRKSKKK